MRSNKLNETNGVIREERRSNKLQVAMSPKMRKLLLDGVNNTIAVVFGPNEFVCVKFARICLLMPLSMCVCVSVFVCEWKNGVF